MFDFGKSIYVTKAVAEELGAEHLFFIVKYLYENHEQLTDYLQVFEFYVENGGQWLIQRQEVPIVKRQSSWNWMKVNQSTGLCGSWNREQMAQSFYSLKITEERK